MSNKVIGPDVWGPSVWHALHYITLGYPDNPSEDNKKKYKQFFTLLSDVLPCSICANHFAENLVKMPLSDEVLQNKESLIKWLIDVHNIVNEMKNKPIIKYEDARKLIENNTECKHTIIYQQTGGENKNLFNNNGIYYLFGLLLLIILITFLFKNRGF